MVSQETLQQVSGLNGLLSHSPACTLTPKAPTLPAIKPLHLPGMACHSRYTLHPATRAVSRNPNPRRTSPVWVKVGGERPEVERCLSLQNLV